MYYLVLDIETTGLDTNSADIIELGYSIYSDTQDTPLLIKSMLLFQEEAISPEVIGITGIDNSMLDDFGILPKMAFEEFLIDINKVDIEFIAGHNIILYDWPVLINNLRRHGFEAPLFPIVDTRTDLPLSYEPKSMALTYMAADHGFLPAGAHRAIFDVFTCARILQCYDLKEVIANSKIPSVDARALVTFDNNKLAKDRGFRWDPDRKFWIKKIKENKLESEREKCPFKIVIV